MIMGTDARAIRQRYIANTTPGVDPQYLNAPNSAFVMAMVLNGLPNVLRASSERESRQLGEALQSVSDHGATPILFRMGVTSANQQTTLAFDTVIAAVTVRNMVQMVTRTMSQSGGAHTGAPPAGPLTP